jgi:transposase-like protein
MVNRAKSDRVKAHANSRRTELNIRAAVDEYKREQCKPVHLGKPKSIRDIADAHKISYGTLNRHIHGGRGKRESNQDKQSVSPVQEWSIV